MEEVLLTHIALPIVRTEGAKRMTNYLEVFLFVSIRAIRGLTLSYLFQLTTDYKL